MKIKRKNEIERKRGVKTVTNEGEGLLCVFNRAFLFLLLLSTFGIKQDLYAQCTTVNQAFQAGEVIEYDLHFNWKFIWVKAGEAVLKTKTTQFKGKEAYQLDLLAAGSKEADFFFIMRDTLTSIMTKNIEPIYFRKGAEEGNKYRVDEAWFTYQDGYSEVEQRRTYEDGSIYASSFKDNRCIYDMLSILARARSLNGEDYKKNDQIRFPMTTGKRVEEQTLVFRGRENLKAQDGNTYRCLVFSLIEFPKKKEKEVITFYITDDKNHLPIRLDLYLNFGSAKAFLKNIKGNRHPLSSIVN